MYQEQGSLVTALGIPRMWGCSHLVGMVQCSPGPLGALRRSDASAPRTSFSLLLSLVLCCFLLLSPWIPSLVHSPLQSCEHDFHHITVVSLWPSVIPVVWYLWCLDSLYTGALKPIYHHPTPQHTHCYLKEDLILLKF